MNNTFKDLMKAWFAMNPDEQREFARLSADPNRLEETANTDPWQPFSLVDAYEDRPPVEFVAGRLFALPSLNIVYGPPGAYKSFLLADLLICVAAGVDWLPPANWITGNKARGIPTRKNSVMWVDFDNGRRRTHDRFGALGRGRSIPTDNKNLVYYSMPSPWLNAKDKASIGNLALRMNEQATKLLVIDNLGVVTGDAEENSGEMASVMSGFRQLAEDTGAAVLLVHHQRKSNGLSGRAGDALRGHSSIEASLDLALLIEREDLASMITIKATKVRGEDVLPFSAVFTSEAKANGELLSAKFFGSVAEDIKSDQAIEREIYTVLTLSETPMNKTELVKSVREALPDVGINRIRDMIQRLSGTQKIIESTGKNNTERLYARP